MKYYQLAFEDFKRVFNFATSYYIDPSKITTGRTSGEPRGLGAIIDSFALGKLTEIGVEKILTIFNSNKKYFLDFEIKNNQKVKNEPDINLIEDNNIIREPSIFIEIKNTSENDRWIGLTEEQFNTIKRASGKRKIFLIYASIKSEKIDNNYKTVDLAGMFLKKIEDTNKSTIFQNFANLNAECKIEFILSSQDLENFGYPFERGMNMYDTVLFKQKNSKSFYSKNGLRKDILDIKQYLNFSDFIELKLKNQSVDNSDISDFKIVGSFKLIHKKSSTYIQCLSDVEIENKIFGKFKLHKDNFYDFNLVTVGRDPKLKRNNIFISKTRIYKLIEDGFIQNPGNIIRQIVDEI